jgi:hypothetical protein
MSQNLGKCPVCDNGDIIVKDKIYACSNAKWKKDEATEAWDNSGCKYSIRKAAFDKFGKPKFEESEVEELLKNGKVEITLKSKDKGADYKKFAVIDKQWGAKIDFSSNNKTEDAPAPKAEKAPEKEEPEFTAEDEEIPF